MAWNQNFARHEAATTPDTMALNITLTLEEAATLEMIKAGADIKDLDRIPELTKARVRRMEARGLILNTDKFGLKLSPFGEQLFMFVMMVAAFKENVGA